MFLTEKYTECFIRYVPVIVDGKIVGIECEGYGANNEVVSGAERRADMQRARKAGCKTMTETCNYLNGER